MARIPEDELENLKRNIDLAALVRSKGIELKAHGAKDLAGLSPFSGEKTPSFIVSPQKNLWHCMSSGQGGSVIDFVMKHDGVSFRHAFLLLKEENPHLFGGQAVAKATVPKLAAPVSFDADEQKLFEQVLSYYRERLKENPVALDYLQSRGISGEAIEAFGIGFADRTLGLRLPQKNRVEGEAVRTRLQKIGLYRESGHEHFNGCVVFPIRDEQGQLSELYGRKVGPKQKSGIHHLYLPGPHRGLFNPEAFKSPEVILCESVIDALTFWCAGLSNVTCIWGTEGFTDEHEAAFRKHQTQKVTLAYDRDKAGDRAAERDAERLQALGIEVSRVLFPPGQDANAYSRKVTPASKSLRLVLNAAEWLGKGGVPSKTEKSSRNENLSTVPLSLAAKEAAKGKKDSTPSVSSVVNPSSPESAAKRASTVEVKSSGEDCLIEIADRSYRVRGLQKNASFEVLKVNLRLWHSQRFYLDTLDFYRAKERGHFIASAAAETLLDPELIRRDLGRVLLALEALQEERLKAEMEPRTPKVEIPEGERNAALELLRSPKLLDRILSDFEACGIVGEGVNLLTGYLAAVSRKLDKPLAIIIQSTSAAGKTSLMEAVLEMMPEEERIKYSAMTGQSLYYLGETNLKHRILAIVEEEGAEKASYALKLLQSEGELTIASTGKDEQGRMKTEEYHVEGPVMIFLTTTAIDIDEELLNRCLVLTVDESREQTQAIHRLQREGETFEGLKRKLEREKILTVHRNAQRLLQPLHVVNPFAPRLTFLSDRTRTRRDHVKYLTLIRTITLLHQYQRVQKEASGTRYIEVTLADIEAANQLAHEVLGRSLDELPPQTRRLLDVLEIWIREVCKKKQMEQSSFHFSRRELRERTGWGDTQLKVHLARLVEMEYLLVHRNPAHLQGYLYELLYDGRGKSGERFLPGLIESGHLSDDYDATGRGKNETSQGVVGPRSVDGRESESPVLSSHEAGRKVNGSVEPETARAPEKRRVS